MIVPPYKCCQWNKSGHLSLSRHKKDKQCMLVFLFFFVFSCPFCYFCLHHNHDGSWECRWNERMHSWGFVFVVCATPEVSLHTACWVESAQNQFKQSQELWKAQPLHACNSHLPQLYNYNKLHRLQLCSFKSNFVLQALFLVIEALTLVSKQNSLWLLE